MRNNILPDVVALEVTYKCNHKCIFCSCPWEHENNYQKIKELSTKEWFDAIDVLALNGAKHITITGGEPLTRSDIKDIIKYINYKKLGIGLISNGLLMTEEMLHFLKEMKVQLSISVPGLETFEAHTGVDNIDGVMDIFKKASEIGMEVTANVTVTKKNIHELYENIAYPLVNGAKYILLNRFMPGGRGMYNKEFLLTNEEINQMLNVAEEVLEQCGRYGHIGTELPYCVVKEPNKYTHLQIGYKCSAVKGFCVVDPSGYIKACNHSPVKVCKVSEIESLVDNEYWNRFLNSDYIPTMCANCNKLDKCDGGCREAAHVNTGKLEGKDPCFE